MEEGGKSITSIYVSKNQSRKLSEETGKKNIRGKRALHRERGGKESGELLQGR